MAHDPSLVITSSAAPYDAYATPAFAAYPFADSAAGDTESHDPLIVIRSSAARYIGYSTRNEARVSTDRIHFARGGDAISPIPAWWRTYAPHDLEWAPDVSFHAGRYWMYYAVSVFGSNHSAIGLAVSATGEPGSWIDQGPVLTSTLSDRFNAIDPNLLVDGGGNWWLVFGSFNRGIFIVRLDPATGKPPSRTAELTHLAQRPAVPGDPIEAPFVYPHEGYYYLFVSFDYCCKGSASNYSIHVGRSRSPTGPYFDQTGTAMLRGGGTTLLASHDWVRGPGGQSVVYDDADNHDLLVYHYYDARNNGRFYLGINFLKWDPNGWPYVA